MLSKPRSNLGLLIFAAKLKIYIYIASGIILNYQIILCVKLSLFLQAKNK